MKQDYLKRPFAIGDTVLVLEAGYSSSWFMTSTVIGFTAKKVRLTTGLKNPDKLVIIDAQVEDNRNKYPELFI